MTTIELINEDFDKFYKELEQEISFKQLSNNRYKLESVVEAAKVSKNSISNQFRLYNPQELADEANRRIEETIAFNYQCNAPNSIPTAFLLAIKPIDEQILYENLEDWNKLSLDDKNNIYIEYLLHDIEDWVDEQYNTYCDLTKSISQIKLAELEYKDAFDIYFPFESDEPMLSSRFAKKVRDMKNVEKIVKIADEYIKESLDQNESMCHFVNSQEQMREDVTDFYQTIMDA